MNNFIKTEHAFGFILNGLTYEASNDFSWVSIKTAIDPSVKFVIEKRGIIMNEMQIKELSSKIKSILCSKI